MDLPIPTNVRDYAGFPVVLSSFGVPMNDCLAEPFPTKTDSGVMAAHGSTLMACRSHVSTWPTSVPVSQVGPWKVDRMDISAWLNHIALPFNLSTNHSHPSPCCRYGLFWGWKLR
jgi:hypothetical protein